MEKIISSLTQQQLNLIFWIVRFIIFILLFSIIRRILKKMDKDKVVQSGIGKLVTSSKDSAEERQRKEMQRELEEGKNDKESFLLRIDLMIERSGLRKTFSFLNTEIYIIGTLAFSCLAFILGKKIFHDRFTAGLAGALLIIFLSYLILYILSGKNYERVERCIVPFLNILENFAGSSDDIVTILGKTSTYIESPLKEYISDFYEEVRANGNTTRGFRNLERKIENEKLRDIIRNLEICSRYEANYKEIIEDSRNMFIDYLHEKEIRKTAINQGRLEVVVVAAMCGLMVWLIGGFLEHMWVNLLNTTMGNGIIVACIILLFICFWNLISFDK